MFAGPEPPHAAGAKGADLEHFSRRRYSARRRRSSVAALPRSCLLRSAEARGQTVDPAVFHVRVARPREREPRFLTWAEADEVRSWMPEHVCRAVPIAILTMLRRGELLGLRDADVDLDAGAITIVGQAQHGQRTQTKTSAGRRTIDIGPASVKLIREQQLARAPNPDGLLFPARSGGAYEAHNFMNRVFKPAARHAGIPELTFHDLRHSGASLMIAAGCNVKAIAEQMGHADGGGLVLRRYGYGRYWARTSDPQLVDSEQRSSPFARVRERCVVERDLAASERPSERERTLSVAIVAKLGGRNPAGKLAQFARAGKKRRRGRSGERTRSQ